MKDENLTSNRKGRLTFRGKKAWQYSQISAKRLERQNQKADLKFYPNARWSINTDSLKIAVFKFTPYARRELNAYMLYKRGTSFDIVEGSQSPVFFESY